jgi:hypothetical protein
MGFSGGGSNILKPHTHDSTILQDGGNLDFQNVTQSNMSSGSVTYSDGIHLQELTVGSPGQQLIVNGGGTAPEWSSEHEQGKLELIEHFQETAGSGSSHTFTGSWDIADDYSKLQLLCSYHNLGGQLYVTINNVTTGVYAQGGLTMTGTRTDTGQNQLSINHDTTSGDTKTAQLDIYGNDDDGRPNGFWSEQASLNHFESGGFYMGSNIGAVVTSIEITTSASSWGTGSNFSLYGYKIT